MKINPRTGKSTAKRARAVSGGPKSSAAAGGQVPGVKPATATLGKKAAVAAAHGSAGKVGNEVYYEEGTILKVIKYLGGKGVVKAKVNSPAEVHDLILMGLPGETLTHVVSHARVLDKEKVGRALGVSTRTIQRKQEEATKPLSPEQGDKTWKFAELMVRATDVLGTQEAAELWFDSPAIGLDQRKPIDLLASSVGASLVEDLLGRMEYGVYT